MTWGIGTTHHVDNNIVCVSIGHEAGKRPSTGHAEASAIVNDDQITTTCLDELGRETNASSGSDDWFALGDLSPEVAQDLGPGYEGCHFFFLFLLTITLQ